MKIFLLGTNHANQYIGHKDGFYSEFAKCLKEIAQRIEIDLIAEEMSEAALKTVACEATARRVAGDLGINHALCDPDNSERIALGILTDVQLRERLGIRSVIPPNKVQCLARLESESGQIREKEWLRRLECIAPTNCLFILGAKHVTSFAQLLTSRGFANQVLCQKWEPVKNGVSILFGWDQIRSG